MADGGNSDIPVTFSTNAGLVAAQIDVAATSTARAESAASKFNSVQKVGELRSGALITQLRGVSHILSGVGINTGHASGVMNGLVHVFSEMNIVGLSVAATVAGIGFAVEHSMEKTKRAKEANEEYTKSVKEMHEATKAAGETAQGIAEKFQSGFGAAQFKTGKTPEEIAAATAQHALLGASTTTELLGKGATDKDLQEAELFKKIGVDPVKAFGRIQEGRRAVGARSSEEEFATGEGGEIPGEHLKGKERLSAEQFTLSDRNRALAIQTSPALEQSVKDKNNQEITELFYTVNKQYMEASAETLRGFTAAVLALAAAARQMSGAQAKADAANGVRVKSVPGGMDY